MTDKFPIPARVINEARNEYLFTGATKLDLAKKYSINRNRLAEIAKRDGWDDLASLVKAPRYFTIFLNQMFEEAQERHRQKHLSHRADASPEQKSINPEVTTSTPCSGNVEMEPELIVVEQADASVDHEEQEPEAHNLAPEVNPIEEMDQPTGQEQADDQPDAAEEEKNGRLGWSF